MIAFIKKIVGFLNLFCSKGVVVFVDSFMKWVVLCVGKFVGGMKQFMGDWFCFIEWFTKKDSFKMKLMFIKGSTMSLMSLMSPSLVTADPIFWGSAFSSFSSMTFYLLMVGFCMLPYTNSLFFVFDMPDWLCAFVITIIMFIMGFLFLGQGVYVVYDLVMLLSNKLINSSVRSHYWSPMSMPVIWLVSLVEGDFPAFTASKEVILLLDKMNMEKIALERKLIFIYLVCPMYFIVWYCFWFIF